MFVKDCKKWLTIAKGISLLIHGINYGREKINDPRVVYYKALRTRNLQKIDRFRNKLVSLLLSVLLTSLDKHTNLYEHTSLLKTPCIT